MIKPQLFSKELGTLINKVVKVGEFKVPKKAVTFDRVTGTGKNGLFEIITFKNDKGEIIKRGKTFLDECGNKSHIITNYGKTNNKRIIAESVYRNGQEDTFTYTSRKLIAKKDDPSKFCAFSQAQQKITQNGDSASLSFFQAGKKPKKIEWDLKYDGSPTELRYSNVDVKHSLTAEEANYLPVLYPSTSTRNMKQKLHYLQRLQEKKYGLEGLLPEVKVVPLIKLNPNVDNGLLKDFLAKNANAKDLLVRAADANYFSGQVRISDATVKRPIDKLVGTFAHEYKHVDDYTKMHRLYDPEDAELLSKMTSEECKSLCEQIEKMYPGAIDFNQKCIDAKGMIMPDDKEWGIINELQEAFYKNNYYKTVAEHDALPLEVRAIEAADYEKNVLERLMAKLFAGVMSN